MKDGILKKRPLAEMAEQDKQIEAEKKGEAATSLKELARLGATIRWPLVKSFVPLSRVTIWRLERKGKFPAHIQLGEASVGWKSDEVLAWLEKRARVGGKAVV
jgi:prophage regulatory protein